MDDLFVNPGKIRVVTFRHEKFIGYLSLLFLLMVTSPVVGNTPPQLGNFPTSLYVKEDEPIGTKIGEIIAFDTDGQELYFNIDTPDTGALVELTAPEDVPDGLNTKKVDIKLKAALDRDHAPNERRLYFTIGDGSSLIRTWITLFIRDVNDEAPKFINRPYFVTIREDTQPGTTIYSRVTATDPDNGRGGTVSYSMESDAQGADAEYLTTFEINQYNGNITLKRPLDYEKHSYYQFLLKSEDGEGLKGDSTTFTVYVVDVQDSPPSFVNLPYSIQIDEDEPLGSSIHQARAVDGDSDIPNNITYSFTSGDFDNFDIDSTTGIITIKNELDRDSNTMRNTGGVYAMVIKASEVIPPGQINNGETTATTLVTITVSDVNDNTPTFNKQQYMATILENMQQGVPVAFQDGFMQVYDRDQAMNSHFELTLQKDGQPYYDFSPLPQEIYSESSILIRVNNSAILDYEKNQRIVFVVVAREMDTVEKKSSSATVTIDIEDMNDNAPLFNETNFNLDVMENLDLDTTVGTFMATDADSNKYGEIKYSLRGGNGEFKINEDNGALQVMGNIDRETNERYYMTVEAKDGGGLRTPVGVQVTILDQNDNKPIFRRTDYEGIVPEEESQLLRPLKVEATDDDQDNTPNSQVSYRIDTVPNGLSSNFTIDPNTGEITLTQPLDFEQLDPALNGRVALKVEASDAGDPKQASFVTVNIVVEDINDFDPEFEKKKYVATIPENSAGGFVVYNLTAQDLDGTSPNNKFIYRIENGAFDKFRINFESGRVTVEQKAVLDREVLGEYTLMISAIDRGTPPHTGDCVLKIYLSDINDEAPEFNPVSQTVELNETAKPGEKFFTFNASDADLNYDLVYSIGEVKAFKGDKSDVSLDVVATGVKNYFKIDPESASVSVLNSPDRETAETVVMTIVVEDKNASVGEQTATGTLTVVLTDYNDNAPEFLPSHIYTVNASETDGLQSIVLQVTTRDVDEDQTISYSIGKTNLDAFAIAPDGTIRLTGKLDRETIENIEFEVIAMDSGVPAMTSTATVRVLVLDVNDNKPIFDEHDTTISVSEDVEIGYLVATLTARDNDKGDFGKIYYTLIGPDLEDGNFAINDTTGAVYVAKELDREKKDRYRLEVEAFDSRNNPQESESTRSSPITFIIKDVDDNPPVFKSISPENPSVSETSPKDLSIVAVNAEDKDDATTDNGRIIYSLTSDTNATLENGSFLFKINAQTGVVKSAMALDGYPGFYYITVMATNHAQKFKATREIIIEVLDVNVDVPRFINPYQDNQMIEIAENLDNGTFVFKVTAEDDDTGPNGRIKYTVLPVASRDGSKVFQIDPDTGRITTKAVLNAEDKDTYELRIEIRDHGYPVPYSATRTIIVKVTDKNDHKPEFNLKSPHEITLPEGQENACTSIDFAVDRDLTEIPMCYYMLGVELTDTFSVLKSVGDICTDVALDREVNPYINAVIIVDEDCDNPGYITEKITMSSSSPFPAMYQPTEKNKLWLRIKVTDINDNPPLFKRKDLALGVTRVTQFGKFIYDLKNDVEDKDTAEYGVDYFEATSDFTAHPEALRKELETLNVDNPFIVFKGGDIQTNMYFKPQMSGYFTVNLKVVDKGGLFDTAKLRISLITDDQRLKIVFRSSIDKIGPLKDEIASRLREKIDYRIVVDSIQTHETNDGKADLAKTDMFIHGEDLQTNEVIPASRLLNVIDQKNNLLIEILNDFNVLEIVETKKAGDDDTFEDKLKMALILVSVVLGPICIILIIVLYYVVRRYQRKLKAATAIAYEPNNSDLYKSDIPGTNLHSYENSNPIFLEKVMLESQDGQNSMDDNVFVTESTFDEQEMAITFVSVDANEKAEASTQQSRPESYLKAVMDFHSFSEVSADQQKTQNVNNLSSNDNDNDSNQCHTQDQDEEDDESCIPMGGVSRRDSGIEERSAGFVGASGTSPEKLDISTFNQVISELKDDRGRNLRKTAGAKNESCASQNSSKLSPLVKILNVDVEINTNTTLDEAAPDHKIESNNNINPFFPARTDKEMVKKRNESLNSPFEVTPAYSEFRNGLRYGDKTKDSVELTDL